MSRPGSRCVFCSSVRAYSGVAPSLPCGPCVREPLSYLYLHPPPLYSFGLVKNVLLGFFLGVLTLLRAFLPFRSLRNRRPVPFSSYVGLSGVWRVVALRPSHLLCVRWFGLDRIAWVWTFLRVEGPCHDEWELVRPLGGFDCFNATSCLSFLPPIHCPTPRPTRRSFS